MKSIRQFCAASVLTIVLAFSTFAGDMLTPGITAEGEIQAPGETVAGEMQTPGATANVMEIALGWLLDVSSLV